MHSSKFSPRFGLECRTEIWPGLQFADFAEKQDGTKLRQHYAGPIWFPLAQFMLVWACVDLAGLALICTPVGSAVRGVDTRKKSDKVQFKHGIDLYMRLSLLQEQNRS